MLVSHVLGHMAERVLRHMLERVLKHMLEHVARQLLRHMPTKQVSGHVLEHVHQNPPSKKLADRPAASLFGKKKTLRRQRVVKFLSKNVYFSQVATSAGQAEPLTPALVTWSLLCLAAAAASAAVPPLPTTPLATAHYHPTAAVLTGESPPLTAATHRCESTSLHCRPPATLATRT